MNIDNSVFAADGAVITGNNITIAEDSSVWCNAVIRCDENESIRIGRETNIQDLCTIHTAPGISVEVGDRVTVGHMSIIHGCRIGNETLIGMGSIIMNNAVIGSNCIIGAGSLVTEGTVIPDGMMAFGRPAKVVKEVSQKQKEDIIASAKRYVEGARKRIKK